MLRAFEILSLYQDVKNKDVKDLYIHDVTVTGLPDDDPLGGGSYNVAVNLADYISENVSVVRGRVMWVDPGEPLLGMVAPGPFLGDVVLSVDALYQDLMQKIADSEYSFIVVDGQTAIPRQIVQVRVKGTTSLEVRCELKNMSVVLGALGENVL